MRYNFFLNEDFFFKQECGAWGRNFSWLIDQALVCYSLTPGYY